MTSPRPSPDAAGSPPVPAPSGRGGPVGRALPIIRAVREGKHDTRQDRPTAEALIAAVEQAREARGGGA